MIDLGGDQSPAAVRVFISYAHDGDAHVAAVRDLWIFLRQQGVDARVDLPAAELRQDWPAWMEEQVQNAEYVLVIASKAYKRRAEDGLIPKDEGRGVRYEVRLIREYFYRDQKTVLRRVLPVLLPGVPVDYIPNFLSPASATSYQVEAFTLKGCESLLRVLTGQPYEVEPPVGPVPVLPPRLESAASGKPQSARQDFRTELGIAAAGWRRGTVVDAVHQRIAAGTAAVVLYGLPGLGKTTTMCDVADELAGERAILPLSLGGAARLEPLYLVEAVRRLLNATADDQLVSSLPWRKALARLLADRAQEGLLVLLDDIDPAWNAAKFVIFFSQVPDTVVLATARTKPPHHLPVHTFPIRPLSRHESLDLIEHQITQLALPADPEQVARVLPTSVLSHPHALCAFLAHAKHTPMSLLGHPDLPDDVRGPLRVVAEAVSELSAGDRMSLAFTEALGGAKLSDVIDIGLALPGDFAVALGRLGTRCLVHLSNDSVEVPDLVAEALAQVDPECRMIVSDAIGRELHRAVGSADLGVETALATVLPLVTVEWAKKRAWVTLCGLVDAELLDRLNQRGYWKEYVLLTRLRVDAADQLGDLASAVQLRCRLARKVAQMGDLDSAWELVRRAWNVLSEDGPAALRADIHSHRAFLAYLEEDDRFALRELEACTELRIATADTSGILVARKLEGNIRLRQRDYQGAAAAFELALAVTDIPSDSKHRIEAETSLAACEMQLSLEDRAEQRLRRVIQQMRASRMDTELPRALLTYALLAEDRGRPAEALEIARLAAALPARDETLRMAITRLIWRLERFYHRGSRNAGPEPQATT